MKKLSVFAAAAAMSLAFTACGGDSSSSNVEREEDSSSSVEESSSSVAEESSSSAKEEKGDLPKGARAATLEDLEKNYSLPLFGTDLYLATGSKLGVFSLWIPDTAWVAFRSDFKDGVLEFSEEGKNGSFLGADFAVADSLQKLFKKGATIKLIVNSEDRLQYSLNGSKYADLKTAKVKISENVISDGSKLNGLTLECKQEKSTVKYSFYEGRYVAESGDEWEAGYYDIQRSKLLMLPTFIEKESYLPLVTMTVGTDYTMDDATGGQQTCKSSSNKYEAINHEKIAGEWVADKDGYDWTLTLKDSGKYSVDSKKGNTTVLNNSGVWDVYGNVLLIKNTACSEPEKCLTGIKGVVSGFDAKKGFNLDHSNTEEPSMPTVWTMPQYE